MLCQLPSFTPDYKLDAGERHVLHAVCALTQRTLINSSTYLVSNWKSFQFFKEPKYLAIDQINKIE
jgi:hypothetical protein